MISLDGKAALVTGGSRGIGAATVKLFAEAGADVVFNFHRQSEAAKHLELDARKHGTRIESLKADLGRMSEAKKLVSYAVRRLGRLDIVVVNAGIWNAEDAPIEALGERDWDEMKRVNLKSAYGVTHYAAAQMIAQKSGRIVHAAGAVRVREFVSATFCFSVQRQFSCRYRPAIPYIGANIRQRDELNEDWRNSWSHESLPEDVLKTGLIHFAAYPPEDTSFLVTRLWDKYLPRWREIKDMPKPPRDPEEEKRLVEEINR